MKTRTYTLGQRCLSYILVVSFFVQSCNNFSNPLISPEEAQIPREGRSKIKVKEAAQSTKLIAQGGHQVIIGKEEGQLTATVEEYLPAGFNKTHTSVPVYVGEGIHIEAISQLSKKDQKRLIEVSLPSSKHKGYVYIGHRGLLGGMTQDSEEEDNQEEGEEVKRPTISSYYVGTGNKEDDNQLKSSYVNPLVKSNSQKWEKGNYVNPIAKPAPQKQAQPPQTSAATEVEFTGLHEHHYQVFKNISVEMAQEVEKQTGLLIPFQPGKTTTEFVGGRGAFGELRLGIEKGSGKYFGIKVQKVNYSKAQETCDEVHLQLQLTGLPHLMPLLDVGEIDDSNGWSSLYQVMPLASLGNGAQLATYLHNLKDPAFKEAILLHVAKGILQGIAAMHGLSKSMAHMDFKPDNLVIDKNGGVYIIDFGCAALLDGEGQIKGIGKGDRRYFSPERYRSMLKSGKPMLNARAIDSWAAGLTLLELSNGMIEDDEKEHIAETKPGDYLAYPLLAQAAPGSYADVIKGLLNPDPSKRLSVQEALKTKIFQQETGPAVLSQLKEFVQTLQWETKKAKLGNQKQGLTSVQQLPLAHFAGYASRPQLEEAVINQLKNKARIVACVGIGGVGKTQLLTRLVHSEELQNMYEHVYWFQLSDQENALLAQYRGLAQELKLVDEKTPALEAKKVLLAWLAKQEDGSILMVFDNADDPELLKSFLPKKCCQVLVSSRSPQWENKISVEVFGEAEVGEMLSKLLLDRTTTEAESKLLGEALGYLPLALGQAIAYMREQGMSIGDYVATYQGKQKELLGAKKDLFGKSLPYSMVTLYQMQLEKLSHSCPEAIQLLEYSSLLAADNIPVSLLEGELLGKEVPEVVYEKAVHSLLSYGLWKEDKGERMIRLHRLMQEVVRLPFGEKKVQELFTNLADRVAGEYARETTALDEAKRQKELVPHLETLSQLAHKQEELPTSIAYGYVLDCIGDYYLCQVGAPNKACILLEKALKIKIINYGEDHPSTGQTLMNLGNAYGSLGDYQKKKEILEKALKISIANFGEDHPSTGITLENLGNAYGSLGDYQKQKELLEKALKIKIANYGEDHPSTGITLDNLGNAYGSLGDYQKQKEILEKALKISIANYGEDHLQTGITLDNLGNAYGSLGDYQKKKEILEKALKISIANYGEDHPSTGITLVNLGIAYGDLGDYGISKKLLTQSLTIFKKHYGEGHTVIGENLMYLGRTYGDFGDYQKARELLEQSLDLHKKCYVAEHVETGKCLRYLGKAYACSGDYQKGIALLDQAISIHTKQYGSDHLETGVDLECLGKAYEVLQNREKALQYYKESYNIFVKCKHPNAARVKELINKLGSI